MKKLLLFLFLFGSGIALLYWLDEDARGSEPDIAASVPSWDQVPEPSNAPSGIVLSGVFEGNIYDEASGRALLFIHSEDSASLGSTDQLTLVRVDLLAPDAIEVAEDGSRRANSGQVRAERAIRSIGLGKRDREQKGRIDAFPFGCPTAKAHRL